MKKTGLLIALVLISFSTYAQLSQTKWKTTLQLEYSTEVYFEFGSDSLKVLVAADSSLLETVLFKEKEGELNISKVSGISNCEGITGIYKFEIRNDEMILRLVSDKCSDRAEALDRTILKKI